MNCANIVAFVTAISFASNAFAQQAPQSTLNKCSLDSKTTFANSPLTGWEREKAIGQWAADCMLVNGFKWADGPIEKPAYCLQGGPRGLSDGGYLKLRPDCWMKNN